MYLSLITTLFIPQLTDIVAFSLPLGEKTEIEKSFALPYFANATIYFPFSAQSKELNSEA